MQAVLLRCKPRARFHFGKIAPDENSWLNTADHWLPSDTLFSALANILADAYPDEVDNLLQHFAAGRVKISSGFYVLEVNGKHIFFLPKPAHYALAVKEAGKKTFKDFNDVKFISKTVWEKGWLFNDWEEHCHFLQEGQVVVAKGELPNDLEENQIKKINLFKESDFPRVKVHTQKRENNFFSLTTISIGDNREVLQNSAVHFYFLLETEGNFKATEDFKKIKTAINMLPDHSIGGERSTGCGRLESTAFIDFTPPSMGTGHYSSVSLTLPKNETELSQIERYQVTTRGGRKLGPTRQLKFVRMLAEGAYSTSLIEGSIAHIGYDKPEEFWRYGKAFCLETRIVPSD